MNGADRLLWGGVTLGVAYSTVVERSSWLWAAPVGALGLVLAVVFTARWLDQQGTTLANWPR